MMHISLEIALKHWENRENQVKSNSTAHQQQQQHQHSDMQFDENDNVIREIPSQLQLQHEACVFFSLWAVLSSSEMCAQHTFFITLYLFCSLFLSFLVVISFFFLSLKPLIELSWLSAITSTSVPLSVAYCLYMNLSSIFILSTNDDRFRDDNRQSIKCNDILQQPNCSECMMETIKWHSLSISVHRWLKRWELLTFNIYMKSRLSYQQSITSLYLINQQKCSILSPINSGNYDDK